MWWLTRKCDIFFTSSPLLLAGVKEGPVASLCKKCENTNVTRRIPTSTDEARTYSDYDHNDYDNR
jgi:hypothetical protein